MASDITWPHRSGSKLAQSMHCCLMAQSNYLKHCLHIVKGALWHLHESHFAWSAYELNPKHVLEISQGPRSPHSWQHYPDSKVHVANMGPTWILPAPDGPHDGPMNFAIRVDTCRPMATFLDVMEVHVVYTLDGHIRHIRSCYDKS